MNDDRTNRRGGEPTERRGTFGDTPDEPVAETMSTHGVVDGTPMYIIAGPEPDCAWIAISKGAEVDPSEHR